MADNGWYSLAENTWYTFGRQLTHAVLHRVGGALRIEVHEPVTVRAGQDTIYWNPEIAYAGTSGVSYYRLFTSGAAGWLPNRHDTLLVRANESGDLVLGGYSWGERLHLMPEQLWLSANADLPYEVQGTSSDSRFLNVAMYLRAVLVGFDFERNDDQYELELPGGPAGTSYMGTSHSILARRFQREVVGNLYHFYGETSSAHINVGVVLVRGLGPIEFHQGHFEYKSFRYELSEAFVSGERLIGQPKTAIFRIPYGEIKRDFLMGQAQRN